MVAPALNPGPAAAGPAEPRHRHLPLLLVLVVAVALAHAWIVGELGARLGQAAGERAPERIQAVYARQIVPQAPPPAAEAAPPPAPAPTPRTATVASLTRAEAAERAASAAPPADSGVPSPASAPVPTGPTTDPPQPDPHVAAADPPLADRPPAPVTTPGPEEMPEPAVQPTRPDAALAPPSQADRPAVVAAAASAAASTATANAQPAAAPANGFVWPPSTRMSYTLTGYYRGEVHGTAQVEWIKAGERYQVHLDVLIGPSFAPLMSRRMSSDGLITDAGLVPQRYDEVTRTGFRTRQATVKLAADTVTLANGSQVPSQPGVQDTASQFVQLTQRFMREPHLLRPGQSLSFPLALPRHLNPWVYDVLSEETLVTPFGEVPVLHLKPRRPDKPRKDLEVEIWYAPTLQYLPARIRIRQDDATYVDLMIEKLPEQAQPEGG